MRPAIVIAAYGPDQVTLGAVRRARALAGPHGRVTVVAALAPGVEPAARCAGLPGVRVAGGVGSEALRAVLKDADPGPILFVHDDVLVTRLNLDRMVAELARRARPGGFVVPWSNDVGMDHFCGPLPEVKRAADRLAAAVSGLRPAPATRVVRPSCVLAERDDLRLLGDSHLVDPRLRLDLIDLPVVIARAVVAHDSTCTGRLNEPLGPGGRPLLVAAMIVRDEEQMLPGALDALAGIVDEIVVCDTGSTDATIEVARGRGARVIQRTWRDDFSWARNEALGEAAARGAWWILTVDADDRILCPDPASVRRMLATYLGEYDAFKVVVENRSLGLEGSVMSAFDSPRIFRAGRYLYTRAVHEALVDAETLDEPRPARLEELRVLHTGYLDEVMAGRRKAERNLELTRRDYEEGPTAKRALEYARAIKMAGGDRSESYRLMSELLADLDARGVPREANLGPVTYTLTSLADDALALGQPEKAYEHAGEALSLVPADDIAAHFFAVAALALGRPAAILEMQQTRSVAASATPVFRSETARGGVLSLVAAAHARLGDPEAALRTAAEALALAPESFKTWGDIVAAAASLPPDATESALAGLAVLDPTGSAFPAVVGGLRPASTARVCLGYCARGGLHPEAVRVGLVASLVAGLPETFRAMAPYAGRLDAETLEKIAERAEARGHPNLAALIRTPAGDSR